MTLAKKIHESGCRIKQALKKKLLIFPSSECEQMLQWQIKRVYKKEWSVCIQEKYAHGKGVMLDLSRYIKGGPIKPKQIQSLDERQITFSCLGTARNEISV